MPPSAVTMSLSTTHIKNSQLVIGHKIIEVQDEAYGVPAEPLPATLPLGPDEALYLVSDDLQSLRMVTEQGEASLVTSEILFGRKLEFGAVDFTPKEFVCLSRDLSTLAAVPFASSRLPSGPLITRHPFPHHKAPDFTVTSGSSNGLYYMLCDSTRNKVCLLLGDALKFFGKSTNDANAEPSNGSPSVASLGTVVTAISTNRSDVLFYVLETHRVRAVTQDTITSIPIRSAKDGHLPSDWPRDLNSIAVGSRGEIYVSDATCVAVIEHGIAKRFKSFESSPVSLAFSSATDTLFIRLEDHSIEHASTRITLDNTKTYITSPNAMLTTTGLPYKPLSPHVPGVFPIFLWSVIASYLDNAEIGRVRLLHPRLSYITNLQLSFHLHLQKSTSGLELFQRIFDTRMKSLLPYLKDLDIDCNISSSQAFGHAGSAQSRPVLPTLHLPANVAVDAVTADICRNLVRLHLEVPISFESTASLLGSLQTLELHNSAGLGPAFLGSLPSGLTRLCLPHLTQPILLGALPQGLIYLDLASALLTSDSLRRPISHEGALHTVPLLPDLQTLIISSSDLSAESVQLLPSNITHLGAEKAEWLTEATVKLLPQAITRLDARQAIHVNDACASLFPQGLLHLDLGRNLIITNVFIKKLSEQCLGLEVLDITHSSLISPYSLPYISLFYKLRRFVPPVQFVRDLQTHHIPLLPRSLEELDLTDCSRLETPTIAKDVLKARIDAFTKSLSPHSSAAPQSPTTESGIASLTISPPSLPLPPMEIMAGSHGSTWLPPALKTLKFGFMEEFPESAFYLLPPTLTHLSLKQCQVISEKGFEKIGDMLPQLKYLNLKYARGLSPEALSALPRSLHGLVLPSATQEMLFSTNFHFFSSRPLTELKLHHPNIRFDSSVFFLLPPTLRLISIPYFKSVHPMHWKFLPIDLVVLRLPEVDNAEDEPLADLPHLLEDLDLSSSTRVTPEGVKKLNQLRSLSFGMDAQTLHAKVQDSLEPALEAAKLINDLPHSLTSISLPRYFMDPLSYVVETSSFVNYPNLRHLVIGKQSSYKLAPKTDISPLATIDQEGIRRAPADRPHQPSAPPQWSC